MKKKVKYPLAYKFDNETFVVWISSTKCFYVKQLQLLF